MDIRLLLAATLLGVTACSVATPFNRPAAAASPGSQSQTHAWLQYTACLRSHGANIPDPTFDGDGNPQWPVSPKAASKVAFDACAQQLPSSGLVKRSSGPPSAADLARETQAAQCIREHGIPDFPDPDPQTGTFNVSSDIKNSPAAQAAVQACSQFMPGGK